MRAVIAVNDARTLRRVALVDVYPCCVFSAATHRRNARGPDKTRATASRTGFVAVERAEDGWIADLV